MTFSFLFFFWRGGGGAGGLYIVGYWSFSCFVIKILKRELPPLQSSSFDLFKPLMRQSSRINFMLFTYRLTPLFLNLAHASKLTLSFLRKPRKLNKGMHLKDPAVPKASGEVWVFFGKEKISRSKRFIALCFAGSVSW